MVLVHEAVSHVIDRHVSVKARVCPCYCLLSLVIALGEIAFLLQLSVEVLYRTNDFLHYDQLNLNVKFCPVLGHSILTAQHKQRIS